MRRLVSAFALLIAITAAAPAAATPPDERQVVEYLQSFLELALWNDSGLGGKPRVLTLHKRVEPVRVRMSADVPSDLVLPPLRQEANLAGLEVVVLPADDTSENLFIEYATTRTGADSAQCFTSSDHNAKGEWRSHIVLDPRRRICIAHELMHAMGFGHAHARDSLMSYVRESNTPTKLDVLMFRVMYDRRLQPGMRWLPAMTAARLALIDILIADGAPPQTAELGRAFVPNLLVLMKTLADQGNVDLQAQLGFAYMFGEAIEQDEAQGHVWFQRAAATGYLSAQAHVGYDFLKGRGVAANPPEGVRWLRLAADRGFAMAQFNLGVAYRDGLGIERDPVEAYKWLSLSARNDFKSAGPTLERLVPTLTAEQVESGKRRLAEWKPPQ